ncbi:carboxylesterase 3-like isoform X2 [Pan paniscus]|uniref:carboxylesterase 3-like isoform X2 n=1 Tax=Pan paniscus TaxID=9597 RepID=UPI002436F2E6|nr:carboxylesterase 3-like isoform X2 [Pan paniscus]
MRNRGESEGETMWPRVALANPTAVVVKVFHRRYSGRWRNKGWCPGPEVAQPEVDTALGRVRGQQVGVKGTDHLVNVFLGIPFAQPPLGPNRFSAPHPAQPWEGVQDASTAPPMCLQDVESMNNSRFVLNGKQQIFSVSEDCLVLNIYSPAEVPAGAGRPVMVWVHGGALITGTATSYDGSALAAYGDVVVVTVQYHLGVLGFFSTGDEHAPGNQGFLDVVAALRWVQGNIAPFGGDLNCVTVFGGSAGGSIISGLKIANTLACSSSSPAEMVQCLWQKEGEELVLSKKLKITIYPLTVDGTVFPKSPKKLLKEKPFHSVPFLMGVNNHEFSWLIPRGWGLLDTMEQMSREDMLAISTPVLTSLILEALSFSEFQHRPSSFAKIKPTWVKADHVAEGAFVFGGPFLMDESSRLAFPEATEEEKQLSLTMMAQWTHFARTGDPHSKALPPWPQFNQAEQYLEINPVPRAGQKFREAWMQFWSETLPSKIQQWHQK